MVAVNDIRKVQQRAEGPATVLAIGTANPPNCIDQSTYADYYFRVTNSEHMTDLKKKFKRICERTMIKNRHMYLTEEILKENPNMCAYKAPSLDAREDMMIREVPRVGKEAATKAIKEWGQPILVGQALFADGAAAIIIGSDPVPEVEKPIFELVSTDQKLVPGSHGAIGGLLREVGLTFYLNKSVPDIISQNINEALSKAFDPLGISDYNSIFWIAHPGGRAILDQVEQKVNLKPEKMKATRDVLSN
ncbi:hypothetical protein Ahy_Scaffold6g107966 [Arachis hypogaea]|uniref:Chalcone/stilbene synthase N-terminal domain-containing protein n=1 Tax=Arachis hypogaea TaxID=3818 RepID=A0A444WPC9_ARAHY|nr:hypothetical protein Ahy_Scaffold6g107966 [Arachis hypogaea]